MKSQCTHGFTLIEVIIAVAIFGIMSVTAHAMFIGLMSQQKHLSEHSERMRGLQLAVKYLERDIYQLSSRDVRDRFGDRQTAFQYDNEQQLNMTYSGWRNPAGLTRSRLQRIQYQFSDGELVRASWNELDGYAEETAFKRLLLNDIEDFSVEFLDEQDEWNTQWPPTNRGQAALSQPRAIAVTLTLQPWGEIRRVFPTPK